MSLRLYVEHDPIETELLYSSVRHLMWKLGCFRDHDSDHGYSGRPSDSEGCSGMSFWWMEPCIYRTMAEHCSWDSSLTCDESMWFTCGDDVTERVLICFTIKATRDTSAIVEVFSSEPVGGDIARNTKLFLLKWIIIFLIHDLKSSKIDGWGKHAERPFLTYLDGEVSVCEIPGWKVGTIRHKDDRDKWKYHL